LPTWLQFPVLSAHFYIPATYFPISVLLRSTAVNILPSGVLWCPHIVYILSTPVSPSPSHKTALLKFLIYTISIWRNSPQWDRASSFTRFLDHTQPHNIVSRNPLDDLPARCRDLYLTTRNTHNRQTFLPPVGFELTILAGEWPQAYTLDSRPLGSDNLYIRVINQEIRDSWNK